MLGTLSAGRAARNPRRRREGRTGLGARRRGEARGWGMNMQDQRHGGGRETREKTIPTGAESAANWAAMVQASLGASSTGCQATDRMPSSFGI